MKMKLFFICFLYIHLMENIFAGFTQFSLQFNPGFSTNFKESRFLSFVEECATFCDKNECCRGFAYSSQKECFLYGHVVGSKEVIRQKGTKIFRRLGEFKEINSQIVWAVAIETNDLCSTYCKSLSACKAVSSFNAKTGKCFLEPSTTESTKNKDDCKKECLSQRVQPCFSYLHLETENSQKCRLYYAIFSTEFLVPDEHFTYNLKICQEPENMMKDVDADTAILLEQLGQRDYLNF